LELRELTLYSDEKMKNKLFNISIAMLVLLNVANLLFSYTNAQKSTQLAYDISQISKKNPSYEVGRTGAQGITGAIGATGAPGINAISFNTTVVKDVPLVGIQGVAGASGIDGKDAPTQELRINPTTGDMEYKLSDGWFWTVLVPCDDYKINCPITESD